MAKTKEYYLDEIALFVGKDDYSWEFSPELKEFDKRQLEIIARIADAAFTNGKIQGRSF